MLGGALLTGAVGTTTAVALELAGPPVPPAFVAVSCTLIV